VRRQPDLHGLRPLLAWCHLARGDARRAGAAITPAVHDAAAADADVAFWLGAMHALEGDAIASMRWLRRSVELGNEDAGLFADSPELAFLRGEPAFLGLLDGLRERPERRAAS